MRQYLKKFICNDVGVAAILFAFSIPLIIGSAGIGVDVAKAYHTKDKLKRALDSAALAGSNSDLTGAKLENFIKDYAIKNFRLSSQSTLTRDNINVDLSVGNKINVSGTATSINTFMPFFSNDTVTVASRTIVNKAKKAEIVLVLDNSNSMYTGTRIGDLKTATKNFVNTISTSVPSQDYFKIGIVPYNHTVSVGSYGLGKYPNGTFYDTPFVDLNVSPYDGTSKNVTKYNRTYTASDWLGGVAEDISTSEIDAVSVSDINPYTFCWRLAGKKYTQDPCAHIEWIRPSSSGTPNSKTEDLESVLPLTNKVSNLINKLDAMTPQGGTAGNYGLLWGWRLISPAYPFSEGKDFNDPDWSKFVILMTDGNNNPNEYSGFGLLHPTENTMDDEDSMNEHMVKLCNKLKSQGTTIFTITFSPAVDSSTIQYYKDCSTRLSGESGYPRYINASDGAALDNAFKTIAGQITNTYLSN